MDKTICSAMNMISTNVWVVKGGVLAGLLGWMVGRRQYGFSWYNAANLEGTWTTVMTTREHEHTLNIWLVKGLARVRLERQG